jgi:hypothetical protein
MSTLSDCFLFNFRVINGTSATRKSPNKAHGKEKRRSPQSSHDLDIRSRSKKSQKVPCSSPTAMSDSYYSSEVRL